ncbi:hypothetical protein M885DRAFT_545602 [Pelagophyceae sp. CCMP2097]|nr:hypothetical protein M885DRAFT_545602 [Pelagophyceae sp. CCMP2097]
MRALVATVLCAHLRASLALHPPRPVAARACARFAAAPDAPLAGGIPALFDAVAAPAAPAPPVAVVADDAPAPAAKRSACVFGWFFASEKELAFVKKKYEQNGFTDVLIVPSDVAMISRPRGWYRTYLERHVEQNTVGSPMAKEFDVVHCLSGGFLNFYLARAAGIPISCKTLVMDSTPILPTPAAFTRFVRAVFAAKGAARLLRVYPGPIHRSVVWARWVAGAAYARAKHRVLRRDADPRINAAAGIWLRRFSTAVFRRTYPVMIDDALDEVFGHVPHLRVEFIYNPKDPFISQLDLETAVQRAKALGCRVHMSEVETNHVQTMFRKPKIWQKAVEPDTVPLANAAA